MKKLNVTSRSLLVALALAGTAFTAGTVAAPSAARADACSDKCQKDWPRSIMHAVPRKACEAKCAAYSMASSAKASVSAAWDKTKELASSAASTAKAVTTKVVNTVTKTTTAVVNKVKEVGTKVVAGAKKLAKGLWDKAKNCIADGLGGCVKKIVTAAGNLAKGLWDKARACVADGLGGCLTKIAKAAAEVVCKGVGIFYDPAKKCCAKKGAVQCAKDAVKHVIKKGAQWLCDKFAGAVVPKLNQGAAWLINKAGAAIKDYKISLRGSEIGSLACAFKSAIGHTVTAMSKKFGDPFLTIGNIKIGAVAKGNDLTASLGATATISVPGKEGALSLRLEGEVDADVDTSCNFQGPLATFGARITKVSISNIPSWLTNAAVAGFVNPSLGCVAFCPKPIQAAGMNVKLDYCKVIDNCLRSNCTAPVLNTILSQVFPVGVSVGALLAGKKGVPDAVKREVGGWFASVGGVKYRAGSKDPYAPSISATVSIGPKGAPKFNINATGSLGIKTYCTDKGSMVKITPSLSMKLGDIAHLKWLQDAPKNIGNSYLTDFINSKGGQAGRFVVSYPSFLSGKSVAKTDEKTIDAAAKGTGLVDKIKANWEGLKSAVKTALAGRFRGDANACANVEAPEAAAGGGGACKLCMKIPSTAKPAKKVVAAKPSDGLLGHLTGDHVNFRKGPGTNYAAIKVLTRCTEFKILQKAIKGASNTWSKVNYKGTVGYIADAYVAKGKAFCKAVAKK